MVFDFSRDTLLLAGLLFALRILNTAIGTIRLVVVTRQQKLLAAGLAFVEAFLFAVTISSVATNLTNAVMLFSYCAGFSVGNYVGMVIERRFMTRFMTVNVITSDHGYDIAAALRALGYGVTITVGEGKDGEVVMLRSVVNNREVPKLLDVIRSTHAEAFVAIEEARAVHRGWVRAARSH
ncbi:MAG: DUF5698 domain-containing protein [Chloroflexota bacterium]